jgi:stearoyl-CoA desaturase (delta-9 desaturase)
MGEAWHHNHHAFPTSAFHGLRFWERLTDPTGLVISLLEKLGIVWNVVRVPPERQQAKLLTPPPSAAKAKALPGQA